MNIMNDAANSFASTNPVGKTYKPTRFMRHPLTRKNQKELKMSERAASLLEKWKEREEWEGMVPATRPPESPVPPGWKKARAKAQEQVAGEKERWITPVGFSVNKVRYGAFPPTERTAHEREWFTYMNMGVPLVEERSDIQQPPPDVVYQNTFVNRTDPRPVRWTATVEFAVSTQLNWQLQGDVQLRFGARSISSLAQQKQKRMEMKKSLKGTYLNSKDRLGGDFESLMEATSATSATGTATGTGELWGELLLGITGSIGGSLAFESRNSLQLSGEVESRAVVRATQRRKVVKYDYELPITFGGYIAMYYDEPVELATIFADNTGAREKAQARHEGGQVETGKHSQIIAQEVDVLELTDGKEYVSQRGEAEIVATLAGDIEVFELESLTLNDRVNDGTEAYLYRK
jgi:hypothetical protein